MSGVSSHQNRLHYIIVQLTEYRQCEVVRRADPQSPKKNNHSKRIGGVPPVPPICTHADSRWFESFSARLV